MKALAWFRRAARSADAELAAVLVDRARIAREAGRYADAATFYGEALRLKPGHAGWHVQHGHMLKESGALDAAEAAYLAADRLRPDDADLAVQFGHLYKLTGRVPEAEAAYARAAALKPGWAPAEVEQATLRRAGWIGSGPRPPAVEDTAPPVAPPDDDDPLASDAAANGMRRWSSLGGLVPALAPRSPYEMFLHHADLVEIRQLGRRIPGYWGDARTLRGIEAVRGFCISAIPIVEVQIFFNGLTIHRGPVKGGYDVAFELEPHRTRKYVFNIWHDFSTFANGRYAIEIRLLDAAGGVRSAHDHVVIADPLHEADYPNSDAVVEIGHPDGRTIEAQVNARESVVRPAERSVFPHPPRAILVQRTDQLGDMVASIPAMKRLREIFPEARIVGLLTAANEAFARTLDLFDEIIIVDFPDDKLERRRLMPLDAQEALRRRLEPYRFDIAMDLAQSLVSRELLRLSGAPFLLGVGDHDWNWLTAGFDFNSHDPVTRLDIVPHSAKVLAMVEALGAVARRSAQVIRRDDLTRDRLAPFGIGPDDRYVVLHTGARVEFSRWPHYPQLARMILDRTDCRVVMLTEDPAVRPALPGDLLGSDRFTLLDTRLDFDDFDAIISFCTTMVGNDSGPKHLASLRGIDVVTLFTNRINWAEWGQEIGGAIITRRVPCAGCLIFHEADECGKDFACIRLIAPEEVFATIRTYIEHDRTPV